MTFLQLCVSNNAPFLTSAVIPFNKQRWWWSAISDCKEPLNFIETSVLKRKLKIFVNPFWVILSFYLTDLQFPFSYERSKISIALRNNCCIEPIVVILEIDSSLSRVFKTRKFVPSYKIISVNRYFDLTFLFQLEKEDDIEPQFR